MRAFIKGAAYTQMVIEAGCEVWYLPPYSPDLNKIERCWSWLKSRIRHLMKNFDTLRNAIENVLDLACA